MEDAAGIARPGLVVAGTHPGSPPAAAGPYDPG